MTNEQRLRETVSELILQVVDSQNDMTQSDLQGFAGATAQKIVKMVREATA